MAGELHIGIVGSTGSDPQYDPFLVVNRLPAKEVIHALISRPLREEDLCVQLERSPQELKAVIEDLLRIGAVRRQADQIWLNFPLITKEDREMITAGSRRAAGHLADLIRGHASEIEALLSSLDASRWADHKKLLFITIGCFGLDWAGIARLADLGYLSLGREYPGGGKYLLIGEERPAESQAKEYCASRSDHTENYVFTSFGDETGQRYALPDIFFQAEASLRSDLASEIFRQEILQVLKAYRDSILNDIGRLLEVLAAGPCSEHELERRAEIPIPKLVPLLELLVQIDYLWRENQVYRLLIPFFSGEDLSRLGKLIGLVKDIVSTWAREHYEGLRVALQSASPLRNGIPFREFFNLIWHSIFAEANKVLAESSFMSDPSPKKEGEGRYVAWVTRFEQHFYREVGFG